MLVDVFHPKLNMPRTPCHRRYPESVACCATEPRLPSKPYTTFQAQVGAKSTGWGVRLPSTKLRFAVQNWLTKVNYFCSPYVPWLNSSFVVIFEAVFLITIVIVLKINLWYSLASSDGM